MEIAVNRGRQREEHGRRTATPLLPWAVFCLWMVGTVIAFRLIGGNEARLPGGGFGSWCSAQRYEAAP